MREIKFRAYLHNEKEVVMVSDINFIEKWIGYYDTTGMNDAEAFELIRSGQHNADCPFERCGLMQYTGLKDKNGVEIYEDDIFVAPHDFGPGGFVDRKAVVKFHETKGYQWEYWLVDQLEIIGNIYENPNLLEG